ncbi:hypothetical protein [Shewanella sedimentimangrovi]|uniref:Uncharacterized protein n=1 Tax=Shewanella sedimentimangrovi TaxID=2814293 RepID=A0ABX7R145_9GAMM|nr:hypothetical protein [Shewanella sedimentimangrovi]QSX36590.1 hypothetical protein JYB85_15065 [Shewanella sedimentimangrovi]
MKNIALQVSIEGKTEKITTDWQALSPVLKQRKLTDAELIELYQQLSAGLRVSTRGLTLAKKSESSVY